MKVDPLSSVIFIGVVILFLIIDLKSHSEDKPISLRNAAIWSAIWIVVSLISHHILFKFVISIKNLLYENNLCMVKFFRQIL